MHFVCDGEISAGVRKSVLSPFAVTRASGWTFCSVRLISIISSRYKIVVQVTIGQMKDQGVRVASRCLWDTATDNYASVHFKNQSLWCSAMVFGVYTE